MTGTKKSYISPKLNKYSVASLPDELRSVVADVLDTNRFTVVVDQERRYKSVPSGFASLLGYDPGELTEAGR